YLLLYFLFIISHTCSGRSGMCISCFIVSFVQCSLNMGNLYYLLCGARADTATRFTSTIFSNVIIFLAIIALPGYLSTALNLYPKHWIREFITIVGEIVGGIPRMTTLIVIGERDYLIIFDFFKPLIQHCYYVMDASVVLPGEASMIPSSLCMRP
ncbi:hypothetical protein L9F63_023998, partial [Diploptera punctata]